LRNTEARGLLKLFAKVKDAPFLQAQQAELQRFIEPIAVPQKGLLAEVQG
jgi:hypothetical protein